MSSPISDKNMVIRTNDEATTCKNSCVNAKYYDDQFVQFFPHIRGLSVSPLIRRGYFYRVCAVDSVIQHFLQTGGKQVCVLGAGFDTAYFRLKSLGKLSNDIKWLEVDFESVMKEKAEHIKRHSALASIASQLTLCGVDLNDEKSLESALNAFDTEAKTLYISEVVLAYLETEKGDNVIATCRKKTPNSVFATYEMINPNDAFGKMMQRKCGLLSLKDIPTIEAQKNRYITNGYDFVIAKTMTNVEQLINKRGELRRLLSVEPLDEFEEWNLIQSHYCFIIAMTERVKEEWKQFDFEPLLNRKH